MAGWGVNNVTQRTHAPAAARARGRARLTLELSHVQRVVLLCASSEASFSSGTATPGSSPNADMEACSSGVCAGCSQSNNAP